ncbi:MAG: acetylxylan esterase [Clostridia bacterium]|nr:acetylxylan esterase [Clostridia bacterium]
MKLPENLPRFDSVTPEEAQRLLCTCEYGFMPPRPECVSFSETLGNKEFCAGKAVLHKVTATVENNGKSFSFPFSYVRPNAKESVPAVVLINFRGNIPDLYIPTEELADLCIAVASFDYQEVSPDNGDFESLAGGFLGVDRSDPHAPGKIAIWAWAASIVMDYVEKRPEVDLKNVAVAGHSRLGKTALFAGLHDKRFSFIWSNDSGCAGAALYRGKGGETAEAIHRVFPFWFCPNYANYTASDDAFPFDQHWFLSLLAPRNVYVASAENDLWADPQNELLSCIAATPAFEALGVSGLIGNPEKSEAGLTLHEGTIGYHCRSGEHYLSREDWQKFILYMKKHLK